MRTHQLLRYSGLFVVYCLIVVGSLWLAYGIRFDFFVRPADRVYFSDFLTDLQFVIPIKLFFLLVFRQFSGLLSYFSLPDAERLAAASGLSSVLIVLLSLWEGAHIDIPRGVALVDFVLFLFGTGGFRLSIRVIREYFWSSDEEDAVAGTAKRIGVFGAGDVGAMFAKECLAKRGLGMRPVVFFDDDARKWGRRVHNIPVVGSPEDVRRLRHEYEIDEIVIAMPRASTRRIAEFVKFLQRERIPFETVPGLDQLASGQVRVSQIRAVEISDLLGRDAVSLPKERIGDRLEFKRVLVTGAGGSIGSELCRQIATYRPQQLLLLEQCEVQLFQIEQELNNLGYRGIVVPLIADVLDARRMRWIFERYAPQVVFHAAAHKHVPLMEMQPSEAIRNNTIGTAKVAEYCEEYNAERFVLISTDKAINPTNVMGASKRLAEIFVQALSKSPGSGCKYMAVRFGNVLGSSGSVIPTFQRQISEGGPVKVTHPDVTRYFMTIPEAAGLVLLSGAIGEGGEIFVLDMGSPVKIVDLAKQLIELSGLRPGDDIDIEFVGLRPGEKLFEELQHKGENLKETEHPKIMRFVCDPEDLQDVRARLDELDKLVYSRDAEQLKFWLKEEVPEYVPYLG